METIPPKLAYETVKRAPTQHSELGIVAACLGGLIFLTDVVCDVLVANKVTAFRTLVAIFFLSLLGSVVGLILAGVSLMHPNRKKAFGNVGLTINMMALFSAIIMCKFGN